MTASCLDLGAVVAPSTRIPETIQALEARRSRIQRTPQEKTPAIKSILTQKILANKLFCPWDAIKIIGGHAERRRRMKNELGVKVPCRNIARLLSCSRRHHGWVAKNPRQGSEAR
jgi:hypothetical protein